MDNVFDAQDFGGRVHGVLLMVWVSFTRRDCGLKKTGFREAKAEVDTDNPWLRLMGDTARLSSYDDMA